MNSDAALIETIRERLFPNSELKGPANLLVMPTLDAAKIAFDLVRSMGQGLSVGPIRQRRCGQVRPLEHHSSEVFHDRLCAK